MTLPSLQCRAPGNELYLSAHSRVSALSETKAKRTVFVRINTFGIYFVFSVYSGFNFIQTKKYFETKRMNGVIFFF